MNHKEISDAIRSIVAFLPQNDEELDAATTPQLANEPRLNLFEARRQMEKVCVRLGARDAELKSTVRDIIELLPNDYPHFEQAISRPDGRSIARQNLTAAKAKLDTLLGREEK